MHEKDLLLLAQAIAPVVARHINDALAPLVGRIAEIEAGLAAEPPALVGLRREIAELRQKAEGQAIRFTADLAAAVKSAIDALPKPKDGIDGKDGQDGAPGKDGRDGLDGKPGEKGEKGDAGAAGRDGAPGEKGERGDPGAAGKDGIDGKDGAPGEKGERGERGADGEKGAPGEKGRDGIDGKDGEPGKDGASLVDIIKDHEGAIVFTLGDGRTRKFVPVDGKDGRDGRDVDPDFLRAAVQDEVRRQVSAPLADAYKGVWREGEYKKGDAVTSAGSLFIAMADTEARPGTDDSWRLAVKKGRDGKDGEAPKPPPVVKL